MGGCVFFSKRKSELRLGELLDMLDSRFHIRNPERATEGAAGYLGLKLRREGKAQCSSGGISGSQSATMQVCRSVALVQ